MSNRVVLVDDHAAIRELLRKVFEFHNEYRVVGEAGDGIDALRVCHEVVPALVVTDLLLPHLCGAEVVRRLRSELPQARIVVFSGVTDQLDLRQMVESRPHGFARKGEPLSILLTALRTVASGGRFFSSSIDRLLDGSRGEPNHRLSNREIDILQLVAEGETNKCIAARLGIAVKTVDKHRGRVMEKLGLHDVAGLTRYAIRMGLVKP